MPTTTATVEIEEGGLIKKDVLRPAAVKATRELEKRYFLPVEKEGVDPMVARIEAFFSTAMFDGNSAIRRDMAEFASVLTGSEIKLRSPGRIIYPKLAVVVPTGNHVGHNYPIGKPVMLWNVFRAIKMDGSVGNNLPEFIDGTLRVATLEEIDAFLAAVPQASLDEYLKEFEVFLS